ncbi:NADAR family protein [Amycolatopsis sp. NPDC059657]|uniref:NADAR family protein n=1 Tax=Amycolatopsis sp. NPDC059657 TaxID=3346899 RepID=UPI00366A74EB
MPEKKPKFLYFWGHQGQGVTKACLSQWWPAGFTVDGHVYPTAEHYMMAAKAMLFDDPATAARIRNVNHPNEAKTLGRQITGFDEQRWTKHREEIVVTGNLAKFGQNADLKTFLVNTGDRILAEASPLDRIWGIGLAEDDERAADPNQWLGLNLLGFALMEVRERLR